MTVLSDWVKNSWNDSLVRDRYVEIVSTYVSSVIAALILIHSYFLHRFKFDTIRICTDLSALVVFLRGPLYYIMLISPNKPVAVAVVYDLLCLGLFSVVVQICDFYLFYTRYLAIQRVSWRKRIFNHWFIWAVVCWTWLPTFTIDPFFVNTRTPAYGAYFALNIFIGAGLIFMYNTYYTIMCILFLRKILKWESLNSEDNGDSSSKKKPEYIVDSSSSEKDPSEEDPSEDPSDDLNLPYKGQEEGEQRMSRPWIRVIKMIAWKSIGHAITSNLIHMTIVSDALFTTYYSGYMWAILKALGMHFWFNWRLEKVLCPGPTDDTPRNRALNRNRREAIIMLLARRARIAHAPPSSSASQNSSMSVVVPASGGGAKSPDSSGEKGQDVWLFDPRSSLQYKATTAAECAPAAGQLPTAAGQLESAIAAEGVPAP